MHDSRARNRSSDAMKERYVITRRNLIEGAVAVFGAVGFGLDCAAALSFSPEASFTDMRPWDVRRFGAKGDGRTLDTNAVQAAIDDCHRAGGGAILFKAGFTYLVGTIYLKDHVTLSLEPNSVILGSDNLTDYGNDVGLNPFYPETIDPCLIYAKDSVDVGIQGQGKIVGHTQDHFTAARGAQGRALQERPMLIRFESCKQIFIADVLLQRCGSWCVHLKQSQEIFLRNIRVENEWQDGFDLESCQNISISDCHLDCGDDAIAITTSSREHPAKNITITNCLLQSRWAGIRFGPLSKGDFENVAVSNCVFYDCEGGGLKLGMFEGAEIRDCVFDNLVMDRVSAPISIFISTWPEIGSDRPDRPMMPAGKIHDLQFRGIRAVTKPGPPSPRPDQNSAMFFQGHPQSSIDNILLADIDMTFSGGGTSEQATRRDIVDMDQIDYRKDGYWTDDKTTWGVPPAYGLYVRHVKGLVLDNLTFQLANPDRRSAVFCSDSQDIRISGFNAACDPVDTSVITARNCVRLKLSEIEARPKAAVLLRLEGSRSSDIVLEGNNTPQNFTKDVLCADGATEKAILQSSSRRNRESH